jgi:hypothetical protein
MPGDDTLDDRQDTSGICSTPVTSRRKISSVSGFPWNSFFISIGPLAGALGGVWIKGRQEADREQRQAERMRRDAQAERSRRAYADVVTAVRLLLRNQRQLGRGFATGVDTEDEIIHDLYARGNELQDEVNRVIVLVEMTGSDQARQQAITVVESVRTCSDIITAHSQAIYAHKTGAEPALPPFPAANLAAAMDDADNAVTAFVNAVRPELT